MRKIVLFLMIFSVSGGFYDVHPAASGSGQDGTPSYRWYNPWSWGRTSAPAASPAVSETPATPSEYKYRQPASGSHIFVKLIDGNACKTITISVTTTTKIGEVKNYILDRVLNNDPEVRGLRIVAFGENLQDAAPLSYEIIKNGRLFCIVERRPNSQPEEIVVASTSEAADEQPTKSPVLKKALKEQQLAENEYRLTETTQEKCAAFLRAHPEDRAAQERVDLAERDHELAYKRFQKANKSVEALRAAQQPEEITPAPAVASMSEAPAAPSEYKYRHPGEGEEAFDWDIELAVFNEPDGITVPTYVNIRVTKTTTIGEIKDYVRNKFFSTCQDRITRMFISYGGNHPADDVKIDDFGNANRAMFVMFPRTKGITLAPSSDSSQILITLIDGNTRKIIPINIASGISIGEIKDYITMVLSRQQHVAKITIMLNGNEVEDYETVFSPEFLKASVIDCIIKS
ncbi:MAG: hypothetical protein US22_C0058G0004 [candidate division TM6 bacterium GW2011_GWF2_36_6]|nr:MAG: hypothetical protein US22_C0058G0004 [candidate division TM6 bacterium GW2011_GWF2_36_6]